MKRIFHLLMAGILGTAMLLGTAACGGSDTGESPNGGQNEQNSGEQGSGSGEQGSGSGEQGSGGGEEEKPSQPEYDKEAPAFDNAQATLTVGGVPEKNAEISSELFGVFLEDINFASQALDDNLVVNGSFSSRYGGRNYGWKAEKATLTVTTEGSLLGDDFCDYNGVNSVASYALVETQAGGYVENSGYVPVPMAVQEGTEYIFSAYIKAEGVGEMSFAVTDGTQEYAAGSVLLEEGGGWVKYVRRVKASGTAEEGLKLRLSFPQAGTVGLDGVSFETTDSTVGIKNYLYDAVKELSPKFIRFPGGCIIEGENLEQAYDWKNSVGAVASGEKSGEDTVPAFTYLLNTEDGKKAEEVTTYGEAVTRKTNTDLWENDGTQYYQMEYGIGFYEYFLLCESLGASALPVLNCGLSCQGQAYPGAPLAGRHGNYVADYIQDAADLIEFAKGDKNTKWGSVRAAMGHEAPFEMNYIGIGNEQWDAGTAQSDYYESYYEKFLEDEAFMAACKKYGVQLIVGNHQQLIHCEGSIDFTTGQPRTSGVAKDAAIAYRNKGKITALSEYGIHDQHYYNSPVDFLLHTKMYDNYVREGNDRYEVFVGEYSANNNFKESGNFNTLYETNNWFSALSEAAAMTGFERNGDIVRLAAYAPMFAPVDPQYRHWGVDMMLFTNTRLVRTANYYVQQLFIQNTGSKKLSSSLEYASGFAQTVKISGTEKSVDVEKLYFVTSLDEATGDIILKIVNVAEATVRLNIDLGGANLTGVADVIRLSADRTDVNTLEETPVSPRASTIGGFTDGVIGLSLSRSSVTCVRIHTK